MGLLRYPGQPRGPADGHRARRADPLQAMVAQIQERDGVDLAEGVPTDNVGPGSRVDKPKTFRNYLCEVLAVLGVICRDPRREGFEIAVLGGRQVVFRHFPSLVRAFGAATRSGTTPPWGRT